MVAVGQAFTQFCTLSKTQKYLLKKVKKKIVKGFLPNEEKKNYKQNVNKM